MKPIPVQFRPRSIYRFLRRHAEYAAPLWMPVANLQRKIDERLTQSAINSQATQYFAWSFLDVLLSALISVLGVGLVYVVFRLFQFLFL